MPAPKSKDPLHGVTLEKVLTELVAQFGWPELGRRIDIRCFRFDPSIKSSLTFLRKTPWARVKVEQLYIQSRAAADRASAVEPPSTTYSSPACSMPEVED